MSKAPHIAWPPPGSLDAQAKGCNCPEEDNKFGRGVEATGLGVSYWCSVSCPIHGSQAKHKIKDIENGQH